jgi:gliding motility-associated-like protein
MKGFLVFSFLLFLGSTHATHIVGGEVYYDSLGNDQYQVTFEVYRDCTPGTAGYDDPLHYTVYLANGTLYGEYFIQAPIPDTLPLVYDDPCVTPPDDVCIEGALYIDTISMPLTADGYYITYQRCCWSNSILNILNPGGWGITITTRVPGTNLVGQHNNCARYSDYPPIVLCANNTLTYDHSATDEDGDSLAYSICTPLTIDVGNPLGAEPSPDYPEPYADIPWDIGFSLAQPFGAGGSASIDPVTGLLTITPNQVGTYVMAICLEEWRNGVLINTKSRTFGYNVLLCEEEVPVLVDIIGDQTIVEGCGLAGFVIYREDSTEALDVQLLIGGTATPNVDYDALPSLITLPVNVGTDTISITGYLDNLVEGGETVELSAIIEIPCENTFDTVTTFITIEDYIPMNLNYIDSVNICDETDVFALLSVGVTNGVPPYAIAWDPWSTTGESIQVPSSSLQPNLNLTYFTVFDACGGQAGGEIKVYHQCPIVAPNVITANGDEVNDTFIIKNLEDYDSVHVMIFNRWGNLVYENENYLNEWDGTNLKEVPLTEGVYTYLAMPSSAKYEYSSIEKAKYTAHGFVHILRE